jgi:cephalosporin hydroxylase
VPVWKCPLDLWVCQELVHELTPDLIVETGTAYGGTDAAGFPSPGGASRPATGERTRA